MDEKSNGLYLAFYGDDFTGSTDALEVISGFGIKTILFVAAPTREQLDRFPDIQAFGIAGMSRSMNPQEMAKELKPAFEALRNSGAPHIHYKVCSTFDSAPHIGSIGKAIDIAAEVFEHEYFSLLVAAPSLGRYCAFGNLFARLGTVSSGEIHRLDRHPSMSRHPVTPANESDLRLHLGKQTTKRIGLVDILDIESGETAIQVSIEKNRKNGAEIILFDCLFDYQMPSIGKAMDNAAKAKAHFSVGSSGVEMALGSYWRKFGKMAQEASVWPLPGASQPLLVVSGSCSPVTSNQIHWALENGFDGIALDTEKIVREAEKEEIDRAVINAVGAMERGKSVLIHSALGTDDPRVSKSKEILRNKGIGEPEISELTSRIYGKAMGEIVKAVAIKRPFRRLIIAGGDTSSWIARELGIEAVEMIGIIVKGAPLCRAFAPGSPLDGMEVNFKGGQVGPEDYFGRMEKGL